MQPYGSRIGIARASDELIYDRFAEEARVGAWAHFVWPSIMAESNGRYLSINAWDRAHFTWGFYQLAAHTPNDNLILLMRALLGLPSAKRYFPDLTLEGGKVAQITTSRPKSLEREVRVTGQRRSEVAGMLWSELRDFDNENAVWEIPGYRTKNKKTHLVPLSSQVRNFIQGLPRDGALVFTTTGVTPVSGFGKAKARLDARIDKRRRLDGLEPMSSWTLHDLRRTMVTVMNEKLGIAPHVVEAVVKHMSGLAKAGVAGVYNRAVYLTDRRLTLEGWAAYVLAVLPRPS